MSNEHVEAADALAFALFRVNFKAGSEGDEAALLRWGEWPEMRDLHCQMADVARHRIAATTSCETKVAEAVEVFERVTRLADTLASDVPITAAARQHITDAYAAINAIRSGASA